MQRVLVQVRTPGPCLSWVSSWHLLGFQSLVEYQKGDLRGHHPIHLQMEKQRLREVEGRTEGE